MFERYDNPRNAEADCPDATNNIESPSNEVILQCTRELGLIINGKMFN